MAKPSSKQQTEQVFLPEPVEFEGKQHKHMQLLLKPSKDQYQENITFVEIDVTRSTHEGKDLPALTLELYDKNYPDGGPNQTMFLDEPVKVTLDSSFIKIYASEILIFPADRIIELRFGTLW